MFRGPEQQNAYAKGIITTTICGLKRMLLGPEQQKGNHSANLDTQHKPSAKDAHAKCIITTLPQELIDEIVSYLAPTDSFRLKLCSISFRLWVRPSFSQLMNGIGPTPEDYYMAALGFGCDFRLHLKLRDHAQRSWQGLMGHKLDEQEYVPFSRLLENFVIECMFPSGPDRISYWELRLGMYYP